MKNRKVFYGHLTTIVIIELIELVVIILLYALKAPYFTGIIIGTYLLQALVLYNVVKDIIHQFMKVDGWIEKVASNMEVEIASEPSKATESTINNIKKIALKVSEASKYIEEVGRQDQAEKMNLEFSHLDKSDQLGKALMRMNEKLRELQKEEEERNWSTVGHANFSDILRNNTNDLEEFAHQVINFLVKYLNCNQGSFFIQQDTDDEEKYLELISCYAYDKRKYQEKKIKLGQGLVGQVAYEKQLMYYTDLPQNYVNITSGLGEHTPTNLVIVPLIMHDEFQGVVELASFYKIENYQREFLEKAAESIASTLGTLKVTLQTQRLLDQSHELTTELGARESETRENIGVLVKAQSELEEKQKELDWIFKAIDNILITATFDNEGKLLTANQKLTELSEYDIAEMQSKGDKLIQAEKDSESFWRSLQHDELKAGDFKIINRQGKEKWVNASFTPMQHAKGEHSKLLMLGSDITEKKLVLEKLSLVANNTDNSVIVTDAQGYIEYVNDGFKKLTGYDKEEVIGQKPGVLLQGPRTDKDTIKRISQKIKRNEPFYEEILNYRKDGNTYWISLMINPVKNEMGKITKYISIQTDVTQIKEDTLNYTLKLEAISRSNAVIEFDAEGNILDVNSIYMSVSGYQKEELLGMPYNLLLPMTEQDKPQVQLMWDNLREGTFFSGEFIHESKQENRLWLDGTFNPIFDDDNQLQKILMFAQFTTHQKQKQSELSSVLDALNNSVMTLEMDFDGSLKKGNPLFLQTLGFKRSEISRKHIHEMVKNHHELDAMLAQLKKNDMAKGKLTFLSKEGEEQNYQAIFNPIQNIDFQVNRVMVVLNQC